MGRSGMFATSSLGIAAVYLNFISMYGAAIVTTLAIVVGLVNLVNGVMTFMEKRKKKKEAAGGSE
jgi:hypothetical protein